MNFVEVVAIAHLTQVLCVIPATYRFFILSSLTVGEIGKRLKGHSVKIPKLSLLLRLPPVCYLGIFYGFIKVASLKLLSC